ncbi:hypothetical protein PAXRUDRAFT_12903 [Paxillus rubicundulus Ve08.2h10]|uniref:Cytochrome P450 n=1 Tax=Paxillus rubicundulus Ve08.2h10 TaxID=930991 RepID=A0A0D0E042_9AGAM|nr:hypothetical protein PAXRUDRAFT_12903 [Paxillus rubicundulus Ve08.2h10]
MSRPGPRPALEMSSAQWTTLCLVALASVVVVDLGRRRLKRQNLPSPYPLPPGPPPLPVVGNMHDINVKAPWLTYSKWSKMYGDLVYARLFDKDIIIISSRKIAKDLLEDRSINYSDRPNIITNELFGVAFNTAYLPYGERWRRQRQFLHQNFKANSASRFVPMQQRKVHQLLHRLLDSPERYSEHLLHYASSVLTNAVYDYDPISDDHIVNTIGRVSELVTSALPPEVAAPLGAFPIILNIPSWFPGMTIKRNAEICREWTNDWVEVPFNHALQRMRDGSTTPAMVLDALGTVDEKGASPRWLKDLKDSAATAFLAAAGTSNATLLTFMLAMVLYPEVQEKVHAQIDTVVGKDRLPTLDDRRSLTYIDAIMRETLRWHPLAPLSLPHAAVNDDVYNGFYIPKGAAIITNIWAIAHDESTYPKPSDFNPERFLNPDGTLTSEDVIDIAFGYGRRICVGKDFADTTLWSAMSTILALFKLSLPKDKDGREEPFKPEWATGITSWVFASRHLRRICDLLLIMMLRYPLPFPCSFVPRIPSMDAKELEEIINAST